MDKIFLIKDYEENFPLIKINAETKEEAFCKAFKGLLHDKYLCVEDVCSAFNMELIEISSVKTYE